MLQTSALIRSVVSALVAAVFILCGGAWLVHHFIGHEPSQTVGLKVIRGIELIGRVPGSGTRIAAKEAPTLTGFVQVGFMVGSDGRAHDIHVIRAVPPGQYEEAAREIIASRRYKPAPPGKSGAREQTEVVNFQVPASVLEQQASASAPAGGGG
jgi:TonB family protein